IQRILLCYIFFMLFFLQLQKRHINSDGNKCIIKFSIKDSQNSYVIVANTALELEEKLKARKNSNNPIQSCLLIVRTIMNPCEIMVYFDELKL
ncbi:C2H2-type domain-containing protein, partial [Aphis craccivora]